MPHPQTLCNTHITAPSARLIEGAHVPYRIPLLQDKDMLSMGEDDFFTYFPLPPESLPEAFPVHSTAPNLSMLPKSGCNGLIVSNIITDALLE